MVIVEFQSSKKFKEGILFWTYSSNQKVFHSNRPFYEYPFDQHDSFFFGEVHSLLNKEFENNQIFMEMLKKNKRII